MAMSMRSRGAAAAARRSRSGVRPVYEEFKPVSEWHHEEGVDILLYQLPEYAKEQIRIIAESKGVLKVHGERLIEGNKWRRFQEEVVVPEHCNISQIRAKFEAGILKIIMPKNMKIESNQRIIENEVHEPSPPKIIQSSTHQKPQELKDDFTSNSTLPSELEKTQKTHHGIIREPQPKTLHDATYMESMEGVHKENSTSSYNNDESKKRHDGDNHNHNHNHNHNLKDKHKMHGHVGNQEIDKKSGYGFSNLKKLTKSQVSRLMDDDRQLLMNMGAAILVIMALGASISYSLGSIE